MNDHKVPAYIERRIKLEFYQHWPGTFTVVCLIQLHNGWEVVGKASTEPDKFNYDEGKARARSSAIRQIRELEGYAHVSKQ